RKVVRLRWGGGIARSFACPRLRKGKTLWLNFDAINARKAGLVLLLALGALAELEAGGLRDLGRIAARPDPAPTEPSEPICLAVWQRRIAAGNGGGGVPEGAGRGTLAESDDLVSRGARGEANWSDKCQDDGAVRICRAEILAARPQARRR